MEPNLTPAERETEARTTQIAEDKEPKFVLKKGISDYLFSRNWISTAILLFFFGLFLWSIVPRRAVEFREGSFTAATVEDAKAYREYAKSAGDGAEPYYVWARSREPAVFREDEIVQVWVDYCKWRDVPTEVFVTMESDEENCTVTQYVRRSSDAAPNCEDENGEGTQAFNLLEAVRPGTIPCTYHMNLSYSWDTGGNDDEQTHRTTDFIVAEKPLTE